MSRLQIFWGAPAPSPDATISMSGIVATALAKAPINAIDVTVRQVAPIVSASGPHGTRFRGALPPAAIALASAPVPTLSITIPSAVATAAAAAPVPVPAVTVTQVAIALAVAPAPTYTTFDTEQPPPAIAQAVGPVPSIGISIAPPSCVALVAAPAPVVSIDIISPVSSAPATALVPIPEVLVTAIAVALAQAPLPQVAGGKTIQVPAACTALAAGLAPVVEISVPLTCAIATATAPAPNVSTALDNLVDVVPAIAAVSLPIPSVDITVLSAAGTAVATTTAIPEISLAPPVPVVVAAALVPAIDVPIIAVPAIAYAEAPINAVDVTVWGGQSVATASMVSPYVSIGMLQFVYAEPAIAYADLIDLNAYVTVGPPTAGANAVALVPLVNPKGIFSVPAVAYATFIPLNTAHVTVGPPAATALAVAPAPVKNLLLPPAATATATAPSPDVLISVEIPVGLGTAAANVPIPEISISAQPLALAIAPVPSVSGTTQTSVQMFPPAASATADLLISGFSITVRSATSISHAFVPVPDVPQSRTVTVTTCIAYAQFAVPMIVLPGPLVVVPPCIVEAEFEKPHKPVIKEKRNPRRRYARMRF